MSLINRDRINEIRQANDIPVRELANIGISRNRYYRYLNEENDLPAEGFISLMSHLLLTGAEINSELVNGHDTVEGLMGELLAANQAQDAETIKEVSRRSYQLFRNTMARGFLRVASLADVLHARLIPDEHAQIAQQILIDSFEAVKIWRAMDVALLYPIIAEVDKAMAQQYLSEIWAKSWPHSTMERLNAMTVRYMTVLLGRDDFDLASFKTVADWIVNEPKTAMSFAWWARLVSQLEYHNWDDARKLANQATELGMTEMAELSSALIDAWYKRAENI